MKKTTLAASMIMESRGLAPAVRGATFTGTWSKLYQAESYHLDMALKPGKSATLKGQLISEMRLERGGEVKLFQDDVLVSSTSLGPSADFSFSLEKPGSYQLALELGDTCISIDALEVS